VFVTIAFGILLLIAFLAFRDRIKYPRFTIKNYKKMLQKAAQFCAWGNWEEAEKELLPLFVIQEAQKEATLLYSQVLRGTKRFEEALDFLMKASRDCPEELLFRLEEGKILLELERPLEAIEAFKVCAPILHSPSDLLEFAMAYFQTGKAEKAWGLIEPLIPHSQEGRLLALGGDCLFEKKKFQEAIHLYQLAIERGWKTQPLLTQLGHAFRKQGNLSMAEKTFRQILEKDPSDLHATLGLGACMQERGFYHKCLLFYQSSKAWEKKDARLLRQAAICAMISKRYAFAIPYFIEVIHQQGATAQLLFYLGYCYEGRLKWQEAEQTYLRLTREFPSEANGYRALAWLFGVGLSTVQSVDEGMRNANLALKLLPDQISWEILSACEARRGCFQRAHQIQEYLATLDQDKETLARRKQAMRSLRKQRPLDDQLVGRAQVA